MARGRAPKMVRAPEKEKEMGREKGAPGMGRGVVAKARGLARPQQVTGPLPETGKGAQAKARGCSSRDRHTHT
jgi:hypothetical protein